MENKIKVLIVDDSALMRNLVSKIVNATPNLTVVATAMNGKFALDCQCLASHPTIGTTTAHCTDAC